MGILAARIDGSADIPSDNSARSMGDARRWKKCLFMVDLRMTRSCHLGGYAFVHDRRRGKPRQRVSGILDFSSASRQGGVNPQAIANFTKTAKLSRFWETGWRRARGVHVTLVAIPVSSGSA